MTNDLVSQEIKPGEHLLWSGGGDPAVLFSPSDVYLIPFSLVWGGFAVFWEVDALTSDSPGWFPVFGGVFVLIGLYLIVGRFFVKAHRKRVTAYAITDRRAFSTTGRGVRQIDRDDRDRTITWSRGRRTVSVVWGTADRSSVFGRRRNAWPGNSGLDGLGGTAPMAFYDVRDGEAMLAALDAGSATRG